VSERESSFPNANWVFNSIEIWRRRTRQIVLGGRFDTQTLRTQREATYTTTGKKSVIVIRLH